MFKYGESHLTTSKAIAILNGELPAKIGKKAKQKIEKCHSQVLEIAKDDKIVYGINTGFGSLCSEKISPKDTVVLQRKLLLSHSVGVGEPISQDLSKLMLILKVHALAQGFSGISMEVLNRILWHIENDVIPVVPSQGSVGASGDLAPLSHLFIPLIGEGKVYYKGKMVSTKKALKKEGLEALELHPKAGLALINGTQFILAHAVMLTDKFYKCLAHADLISAMMVDGLKRSAKPYRPELHQTRPFKGNVYVAKRMTELLKGSEIMNSHQNCALVQDPYSIRCIPQVHGSSRSAWLHLKEAVEVEMNSVTDNPVIFSKELTISGGSFHGQPLALPIDYACLAIAELGNISDRRSYLSLEGTSEDTPKLLMQNAGLDSGFMILQYVSAALVSENKTHCFPASADSIPTSLGQEDHVSMGSIGARKALKVCDNLEKILAIELLCASQAIDFKRPLKSSKIIDKAHKLVRSKISHASEDRIFSVDIEKAIKILQKGKLLEFASFDKENEFEKY